MISLCTSARVLLSIIGNDDDDDDDFQSHCDLFCHAVNGITLEHLEFNLAAGKKKSQNEATSH